MDNDFDRSLDRLVRGEETRARLTGFGTSKQGQAIGQRYRAQLADIIAANRAHPATRERQVWRALGSIKTDDLAIRLLVAGISVAYAADLGVDADGRKNFRETAFWIARNLVSVGDCELATRIGTWGINQLCALPIFEEHDGLLELVLTDPLDAFLDDVLARAIVSNPLLTPSTMPPEPWTQVRSGGLPADHWARPPLIRDHHASIENAARKAIGTGQMQPLLDAIHVLQTVPFSINLPVLHFLRRTARPPLPPPPDKSKLTPDQYWYVNKTYSEALAEQTVWDLIVATAEAMPERLWLPLNIDFRGRVYPIPHFNFTRDDRVRGLFLFADGKPVGEDGLRWLKAHVAARADGVTWSDHIGPRLNDLNFEDRIAWTDANSQLLLKIGKAVLDLDDPSTIAWALPKDEPCQFIAACAELAQAWDNPEFITRLPLTFDASCSGLQHLCAMTRDEIGGRFVNLIPSEAADDFYRRVAFEAFRSGAPLEHPLDRKKAKQPGMTYFYGAGPGGWSRDKKGKLHPFGMVEQVIAAGCPPKHAKALATKVHAAIEKMVERPKEVRGWLENLAERAAARGKALHWTTPLGLKVINIYQPALTKNISVQLNGRKRNVKLTIGDKPGIDAGATVRAITANFVHSADAAHLQLVALAAAKEGIEIVTVHDCFGTIAPHAGRLNEIIRGQFVDLHKRHNWLANVWTSLKAVAPFTNIGTLDLEQVRQSFAAYR